MLIYLSPIPIPPPINALFHAWTHAGGNPVFTISFLLKTVHV